MVWELPQGQVIESYHIIEGTSSLEKQLKAGVPQGSILGPLLFLIFINDIINDINCGIRLFADATSLYLIVDNPQNAAKLLNSDLVLGQTNG